jgi:thiamine-monophosphate kinase
MFVSLKLILAMDEFALIEHFFKIPAIQRADVVYGIGDDAACLTVSSNHQLFVSTDTLVAEVHFLSSWDAYDIAWRAVMVNVSDMAAMAVYPCWISLALTLPYYDEHWLNRFAKGLHAALHQFNIALIGGDTTRGPLSITLTIHGTAPIGVAIPRSGARIGDTIWVSGDLGGAAQAVAFFKQNNENVSEPILLDKLKRPCPRLDLLPFLRLYASAAIDISDGLGADLNHLCQRSSVGACITSKAIPIHPLVKQYQGLNAIDFAINGGDDYELCFTTSIKNTRLFMDALAQTQHRCYPIGVIEKKSGLRILNEQLEINELIIHGYCHF